MPSALSIIYGFVLLTVFIYVYFRRPRQPDPRQALYHAWEGLQDALDGDLDTAEAARIEVQLAIAKTSDWDEIVSLAEAMGGFLQIEELYFHLSQFSALTATLLQLAFLQILLAYRRWYLQST